MRATDNFYENSPVRHTPMYSSGTPTHMHIRSARLFATRVGSTVLKYYTLCYNVLISRASKKKHISRPLWTSGLVPERNAPVPSRPLSSPEVSRQTTRVMHTLRLFSIETLKKHFRVILFPRNQRLNESRRIYNPKIKNKKKIDFSRALESSVG